MEQAMSKGKAFLGIFFVFVVVVAVLYAQGLRTVATYLILIGGILLFLCFFAVALMASSTSAYPSPVRGGAGIVPMSVNELLARFKPDEFEYFSATVVMVLG